MGLVNDQQRKSCSHIREHSFSEIFVGEPLGRNKKYIHFIIA